MSALRLKPDENMPTDLASALRQAGHDVQHVCGEGLSGCTDPTVSQAAIAEGRVLVTLDLDFRNLHAYRPGAPLASWYCVLGHRATRAYSAH